MSQQECAELVKLHHSRLRAATAAAAAAARQPVQPGRSVQCTRPAAQPPPSLPLGNPAKRQRIMDGGGSSSGVLADGGHPTAAAAAAPAAMSPSSSSSSSSLAAAAAAEQAWAAHLADEESLRRYAIAMRTLSEVHWCRADRPQRESTAWCETTLHEYFGGVACDDGQATPAVAGDGGCKAGCGQSTAETGGAAMVSGLAAALAKDLRRSTYAAGKPTMTAPPLCQAMLAPAHTLYPAQ
jgi:hypothetical protein